MVVYDPPSVYEFEAMSTDQTEKFVGTFRRIKTMIQCFSRTKGQSFAQDEITRGTGTMFKTSTVSVWVAFGFRVLLTTFARNKRREKSKAKVENRRSPDKSLRARCWIFQVDVRR